jgi:ABC-type multidrug transport system fused ATPase/permease subunit
MLVELVALSGAFIFYLSGEARRALERPVLDALYNNNREVLAGAANELLNSACDVGNIGAALGLVQNTPGTASPCCAAGIPDQAAAATRTLLGAMSTPDADRNEVATQNRWVFRTAILYVGMAVVAFFVAYVTNRLAGGPQVNIPSIVRYNVFLLAVALGLQVTFMFMVTLRYVPTEASTQWRQLRAALNAELGKAAGLGGAGGPPDEDMQVVPRGALLRNAVLVGMLALSAVVVWFAWRKKAFQTVSFAESVAIQTFFIGVIMTAIYFTLSQSVARDIQGAGMAAVARTVAGPVRADPEAAESLRQEVNRIMDAREEEVAAVDAKVRERNAEVMRPFRWIAIGFVASLVLVVIVSAGRKVLSPRFLVALLAVGLVGGATSVTVEYGFLQNVFRNFRPLNAEKLVNRIAASSAESVVKQARWYCERGCPSGRDACCEDGAACAAAGESIWPYLGPQRE